MKQPAGKVLPITAMQVLYDVQSALGEVRKVAGKAADDVPRLVRSVVDYQVELSAALEDLLPSAVGVRIADDQSDASVVVPQPRASRVYVAAHDGFGGGEKFAPNFERAAILNPDFKKA